MMAAQSEAQNRVAGKVAGLLSPTYQRLGLLMSACLYCSLAHRTKHVATAVVLADGETKFRSMQPNVTDNSLEDDLMTISLKAEHGTIEIHMPRTATLSDVCQEFAKKLKMPADQLWKYMWLGQERLHELGPEITLDSSLDNISSGDVVNLVSTPSSFELAYRFLKYWDLEDVNSEVTEAWINAFPQKHGSEAWIKDKFFDRYSNIILGSLEGGNCLHILTTQWFPGRTEYWESKTDDEIAESLQTAQELINMGAEPNTKRASQTPGEPKTPLEKALCWAAMSSLNSNQAKYFEGLVKIFVEAGAEAPKIAFWASKAGFMGESFEKRMTDMYEKYLQQ